MSMNLSLHNNPVPATAKWAFTTRRVNRAAARGHSTDYASAVAGDLLLGRIEQIGQHKNIQLCSGRNSASHVGDYVVVVVGDRYAPDQFEGVADVRREGCDLLAGGGIVGRAVVAHGRMAQPTRIRPLALLTDKLGDVLNVASYALAPRTIPEHVTVVGVFGTSMNSGKTTAAASLAHGLKLAGHSVAAVKATGTGAFGDYNAFADAGVPMLDFTDAGMATTYKMSIDRIEAGFQALVGTHAQRGAQVVVVEFADGVFQLETEAIVRASAIRDRLDGVLFACGDAAGAVGGVNTLRAHGIEAFAVSGLLSRSPLASKEAQAVLGLPVLTREALHSPARMAAVMAPLLRGVEPVLQAA